MIPIDKTQLMNEGVTCNRIGEVFTLTVPTSLQLAMLGGDLGKCSKRMNDELHTAIFAAFRLNYKTDWWMEPSGGNTIFHQLWDDSLEATDP